MFQIWQTVTATSIPADGQRSSDRTALLRTPGGQDPYRDTHSGYASQWRLLQLALHGDTMTSGPHLGSGAHIQHVGHCLDVRCVSLVVLESVANYQQRQQFTATVPEWTTWSKSGADIFRHPFGQSPCRSLSERNSEPNVDMQAKAWFISSEKTYISLLLIYNSISRLNVILDFVRINSWSAF